MDIENLYLKQSIMLKLNAGEAEVITLAKENSMDAN